MLDLFRSQKKTVKWLLSALLGAVALSMVITLIPNLFSSGPSTNLDDPVLIEVGDASVTINDVYAALREYARSGTPAESMAFMARQIIDNLVEDRILLQEAERLGVKPSERELADWIKDQMPFLWQSGTFDKAQYQQVIAQRFQMGVPQFEQDLLRDLTIELRLRQLVTDNIVMTEEEVRQAFIDRNEKTRVEFVMVDPSRYESQVAVNEEELQKYFADNRFRYRAQEQRTVKMVTIDDSSAPEIAFSDAEIETYYNQNRYRFETPERVLARHILFMTTDPNDPGGAEKTGAELEAIEKKAREVLEKVRAGEDFAKLAEENSDDPGSKGQGGELGWVVRGMMVPKFEDALFALQPGATSDLVKTEFGYHIIRNEKRDPPLLKPLDEAREEIVADLRGEREQLARMERVEAATTAIRNAGDDVEGAARAMNLPVEVFADIDRRAPPMALAPYPTFAGAIFSALTPGEVLSHSDETRTMIAKVISITPPRDVEFAEVAGQVRADFIQSQARQRAEEAARELAEKAKAAGDLSPARQMGLTPRTSEFFTRRDSVEGFAAAQVLGDPAFRSAIGTVLGPVAAGDSYGVYRVIAKEEPDMTMFLEQRDQIKGEFLQAKRDEAFSIFRALLAERYQTTGKIKRYDARIEQLIRQIRTG